MGHLELAGRIIGKPQQRLVLEIEDIFHQSIGLGHMQVTMNVDGAHTEFFHLDPVSA